MKENYLHYESDTEFEILKEYGHLTKNLNKLAVSKWNDKNLSRFILNEGTRIYCQLAATIGFDETIYTEIIMCVSVLFYSFVTVYTSVTFIPCLLDIVIPLNESRPRSFILITEYYVDSNNYNNYLAIMIHHIHSTMILSTFVLTIDGIFIVFMYHACGQFEILGYT